jgi:serine/threonine protein kinase
MNNKTNKKNCIIEKKDLEKISSNFTAVLRLNTKDKNLIINIQKYITTINDNLQLSNEKNGSICTNLEKLLFGDEYGQITKRFSIFKYINCGSNGCVFGIYDNKNNNVNLVIKTAYLISENSLRSFSNELETHINLLKAPGYIKIAPPIHNIKNNQNYLIIKPKNGGYPYIGLIIMEELSITLENFLKSQKVSYDILYRFTSSLFQKIKTMWSLKYIHNDLHLDNIMLNSTFNDVFLIDFGMSVKFPTSDNKFYYLFDVYNVMCFVEVFKHGYKIKNREEISNNFNMFNIMFLVRLCVFFNQDRLTIEKTRNLNILNRFIFLSTPYSFVYFVQYACEKKRILLDDANSIRNNGNHVPMLYLFNLFRNVFIEEFDTILNGLFVKFTKLIDEKYNFEMYNIPYDFISILKYINVSVYTLCSDFINYTKKYENEPCVYDIKTIFYNPILHRIDIIFNNVYTSRSASFFNRLISYFEKQQQKYYSTTVKQNFNDNNSLQIIDFQPNKQNKRTMSNRFITNIVYNRLCYIASNVIYYTMYKTEKFFVMS